jgi:hypothetical protein
LSDRPYLRSAIPERPILVQTRRHLTLGPRALFSSESSVISLFKTLSPRPPVRSSRQQQQREPEHDCADEKRHHGKTHYAA